MVLWIAVASCSKSCKDTGCKQYGANYCCSYWGRCGYTQAHCGTGKYACLCDCPSKGPCKKSATKSKSVSKPAATKVKGSCTYRCTTDPLNVRTGPGTGYSKVTTLPKGTKVCVNSVSNGWAKLNTGNYVSNDYLRTCSTGKKSAKSSASNSSAYSSGGCAQKDFSTRSTSAERNIYNSGCYFICYCKVAGITTKQGILNAYDRCLRSGAIRSDCYVYHPTIKSTLGVTRPVTFVEVPGSGGYNSHWLLKVSDSELWDPWDAAVHPTSSYRVRQYVTH